MHQNEIALWGKITAGITHEMKNVLAIINESTGLMQDIMNSGKKAPVKYQDKMIHAAETIGRQIRRGVEIADYLNKFAHSTDQAKASVDLNEISSQVIFLLKRFAGQKQVELESPASGPSANLYTRPFRLILTLSGIMYHLLDKTRGLSKLTMTPLVHGGQVQFEIILHPFPDEPMDGVPGLEEFSYLDEAVGDLGAVFRTAGETGFTVVIPLQNV